VIVLPFPISTDGVLVGGAEIPLSPAGVIVERGALPDGGRGLQAKLVVMAKAGGADAPLSLALAIFRDDERLDILDGSRLIHLEQQYQKIASGWVDMPLDTEFVTLALVGKASVFAGSILAPTIMLRGIP
jgi:hypothetical protein